LIFLQGTGQYNYDIVGEKYHQRGLEHFAGPKNSDEAAMECLAGIELQKDNPHDANAVRVSILDLTNGQGVAVGFLSRAKAKAFRKQIAALCIDQSQIIFCRAMIVGGWRRWEESWDDDFDDIAGTAESTLVLSEGLYGVKLDLRWPCRLDPQFTDINISKR
jgi:hypothetical protein